MISSLREDFPTMTKATPLRLMAKVRVARPQTPANRMRTRGVIAENILFWKMSLKAVMAVLHGAKEIPVRIATVTQVDGDTYAITRHSTAGMMRIAAYLRAAGRG